MLAGAAGRQEWPVSLRGWFADRIAVWVAVWFRSDIAASILPLGSIACSSSASLAAPYVADAVFVALPLVAGVGCDGGWNQLTEARHEQMAELLAFGRTALPTSTRNNRRRTGDCS